MKITREQRKKLNFYLKQFYKRFPDEKYTVFHFVKYFKTRLKNNKDAWMGVSGETGCQPKDSKVVMSNGTYKPIQEVQIGDRIISPQLDGSNTFETVFDTCDWLCEDMHTIKQLNKQQKTLYRCSHNHLIPFHSRKIPKINGKQDSTKSFWTIEHKEAKDYAKLSKGGKGHNKIGFSTWAIEKYENRINSSVDPYALGVYIGDGNSTTGNVNITTSHESIINKIPYKFLSARKKNGTEAKNYYYSKMGDFTQEITRLDLLKKKSAHKFIPKECLLSDKNYRIKLLAGLIDTDGYLGKNCLSYSTISEQLAKDVEQLVYSLGGRATINHHNKFIKYLGRKYKSLNVSIYLHDLKLPLQNKKKQKTNSCIYLDSNRIAIDSIKENKSERVYGFSITGKSQWYVTDNNMITHNTGKSLFVIMCQMLFGRPYDLTKNIAYIPKGDEISKMFDTLEFNTLLIDEAAREMRSVNWQSKAQQGVNMKAMTDRFKNNWIFLNMPNFNEFTKSMRQGNIKFRAVVPYRTKTFARVIIQMKSRNWRSDDPWSDDYANKIYEKMEKRYKEINNELILKIERALPNTIMDFIVPNLEVILPEVTTEYERLKMESRKVDNEEKPDNKMAKLKTQYNDLRIKFAKFLNDNPLGLGLRPITKQELSSFMGCSPFTFNRLLNFTPEEDKPKKNFRKAEKKEDNPELVNKPKYVKDENKTGSGESKVMNDFSEADKEIAIKQNEFKNEFEKLKK